MGSRLEHRAREARFWELLRQGLGRTAACDAVGVDRRQGYRWVKAAGGRNPFAHKPRSDRYLSQEERLQIADLRLAGEGVRAIAKALGRAPSTISRELTRNSATGRTYRPYSAEKQCR
ncbi:helix-turn-helix domain-containing protein, partial [Curtobacterium flaccumfaciens]|uniref:helix-turn-helix domain-containing protein n=2 Tax=Curtobacterium TaxID=2034 RepID=UPI003F63C04D